MIIDFCLDNSSPLQSNCDKLDVIFSIKTHCHRFCYEYLECIARDHIESLDSFSPPSQGFNPFSTNALVLYPLKTSNFWCFQGV